MLLKLLIIFGLTLAAFGCGDTSSETRMPETTFPDDDATADTAEDLERDIATDGAQDTAQDVVGDSPQDAAPDTAMDMGDAMTTPDMADDTLEDMPSDTPEDVPSGGQIAIYLAGDQQPQTFTDGLSGQTPTNYEIALSAYQVQTALNDPSPQPCFDHGTAPVVADLSGDTLMGTCATSAITTGQYTHGRVRVDWARYQVNGTLHAAGQALPGQLTFFRAYSAVTYEGQAYQPGEGWIRYAGVTDVEIPMTFTDPITWPGITTEVVNGAFWLTFPFGRPLPIVQGDMNEHWARFHWQIFEAFRWQDDMQASFTTGVWDVVAPPGISEPVLVPGVSGFFVTTSVD